MGIDEDFDRLFASARLRKLAATPSPNARFDIFLSHSYHDARAIHALYELLIAAGYSVYVDWITDADVDRNHVTAKTADLLRNRMRSSSSLIYATSEAACKSKWMPWELGYMDAHTNRVCIAPIAEHATVSFHGSEYLGLYPYLDKAFSTLWVNRPGKYVSLSEWQLHGL